MTGYRGDLYKSVSENGKRGKLDKLDRNINTPYWESFGAISGDGKTLYFSTNRPGGYGSLDIYSSTMLKDGSFGPAKNLGPVINTRLEENTPYFDQENNRIWFSSTGHKGFGGYDIFMSVFERRWSTPVHLEYPLNTPVDNLNFVPFRGENRSGMMSILPSDTSRYTSIYTLTMLDAAPVREIVARGLVKLGDGMEINPDLLKVELYSSKRDSLVADIRADSTGSFEKIIGEGSFTLTLRYPGYTIDTLSIIIDPGFRSDEIRIEDTLVPESITRGEYLKISNILFAFDSYALSRESMVEIEKDSPGAC
ncbi:MAG: hypothetical protein R2744_04800 [Bacteroidales bacterium]